MNTEIEGRIERRNIRVRQGWGGERRAEKFWTARCCETAEQQAKRRE